MSDRPFWKDNGVSTVLWCVFDTASGQRRYYAAFAHLPDAEEYIRAMRKLNPGRTFGAVAE